MTGVTIECNRELKSFNLTSAQLDVIFFLFESSNCEVNQKDIQKHLGLRNPTVTGILNRLEEKGFITRISGVIDRRYKKIVLTDKSSSIRNQVYQGVDFMEARLMQGLTAVEQDNLQQLIKKVLKNIGVE